MTDLLTILKRTTKVTKRQDYARNSASILVAMYTYDIQGSVKYKNAYVYCMFVQMSLFESLHDCAMPVAMVTFDVNN